MESVFFCDTMVGYFYAQAVLVLVEQ